VSSGGRSEIAAPRTLYRFRDLIGRTPALLSALEMARRAAELDGTALITGESGTGKEVLAQAIHSEGARAGAPFVAINCASLPRDLLEAELFGYERGAFTGARPDGNAGKFELAGRGTILLDEIGEMPLEMQPKLLRVLQERVVTRLGGNRELPVAARVIATTHRCLERLACSSSSCRRSASVERTSRSWRAIICAAARSSRGSASSRCIRASSRRWSTTTGRGTCASSRT
jgi:transcriptional regulator with PAS, ATPase and Fis domain